MYPQEPFPQHHPNVEGLHLPSLYSRLTTALSSRTYRECGQPEGSAYSCNSLDCKSCGSRLATKRAYTAAHPLYDSPHAYLATFKNLDPDPVTFDPAQGRRDVRAALEAMRDRADVSACYSFEIGPETGSVHAHALVRSASALPVVSNASLDVRPLQSMDDADHAALYLTKDVRDSDTRLGALALNGGRVLWTAGDYYPEGSWKAQRQAIMKAAEELKAARKTETERTYSADLL